MMTEKDQWKQDHSLMRHYWAALVKIRDCEENPAKIAADALENFMPPDSHLWERNVDLEACIRKTCNNSLDLGYCDMDYCRNCDVTKTLNRNTKTIERKNKMEEKLHWYMFVFVERDKHANMYSGLSANNIPKSIIEENKTFCGMSKNAMCANICYLGHMTKEEFEG